MADWCILPKYHIVVLIWIQDYDCSMTFEVPISQKCWHLYWFSSFSFLLLLLSFHYYFNCQCIWIKKNIWSLLVDLFFLTIIVFQLWHWRVIIVTMIVQTQTKPHPVRINVLPPVAWDIGVRKFSLYKIIPAGFTVKDDSLPNNLLCSLDGVVLRNRDRTCFEEACYNISFNAGVVKIAFNKICCDSDLCNNEPFPGKAREWSHSHSFIFLQQK